MIEVVVLTIDERGQLSIFHLVVFCASRSDKGPNGNAPVLKKSVTSVEVT